MANKTPLQPNLQQLPKKGAKTMLSYETQAKISDLLMGPVVDSTLMLPFYSQLTTKDIDFAGLELKVLAQQFPTMTISSRNVDYEPHIQMFTIIGTVVSPKQLAHHLVTFEAPSDYWYEASATSGPLTLSTAFMTKFAPPPPFETFSPAEYAKPFGDCVHIAPDEKMIDYNGAHGISGKITQPPELAGAHASAHITPDMPPVVLGVDVVVPLSHLAALSVTQHPQAKKITTLGMLYGASPKKLSDYTLKQVASPYRLEISSASTQLTYVPKTYSGPTAKQVIKALAKHMDNVDSHVRVILQAKHKGRTQVYIGYWYLAHEWLGGLEEW